MKLELARAMLYNADLLLLDEVRNRPFSRRLSDPTVHSLPTMQVILFTSLMRQLSGLCSWIGLLSNGLNNT